MANLLGFASRPVVVGMSAIGLGFLGHYTIRSWVDGIGPQIPEDLSGQLFVMTGCSSGVGQELVTAVAARHGRAVLANRDYDQCTLQRRDLVSKTGNKLLHCRKCDLSDYDSVRRAAEWIIRVRLSEQPITCLILNAATKRPQRLVTQDGVELQLGVNHTSHFLLTNLLIDRMLAQDTPSRIVVVDCDGASNNGNVNFDDLNRDHSYEYVDAFKQSKYANLSFAYELSRRCEGTSVSVVSVSPGMLLRQTQLDRKLPYMQNVVSRLFVGRMGSYFTGKNVATAFKYVMHAATSDAVGNGDRLVGMEKVDYPESVRDDKERLRLWLTDEKWTQLDQQRQRMYADILEAQTNKTQTIGQAGQVIKVMPQQDIEWVKSQLQQARLTLSNSLTAVSHSVGGGDIDAQQRPWYRWLI